MESHNKTYMKALAIILPILQKYNIESVEVSFEGCGDDGAIHDITFTPSLSPELEELQIDYQTASRAFSDGKWLWHSIEKTGPVQDVIEKLTYEFLETTQVDWYNNEGGFGKLVIDTKEESVSLDVNVNYYESSNEFSSKLSINTGEDILAN